MIATEPPEDFGKWLVNSDLDILDMAYMDAWKPNSAEYASLKDAEQEWSVLQKRLLKQAEESA